MQWPKKEVIGEKLLEFPLLRQLLFERWFRWAFALIVLVFVFLGLFLPKIWKASAPDFRPIIRVSGLDLVQAWSLKRTALKAAAAGNFDEANYAWQSALANNRADRQLVRGALECVLKDPHRGQRATQAVQESLWLLKLTGTNLVDLELAAQVLEQYRHYEQVLVWLEPRLDQLTPVMAATYLKALFSVGNLSAFNKRWDRFQNQVQNDPEIAIYRAAYLVGWGPPGTMTQAREQLENATKDPNLRILAYRLKLALSAHELNVSQYGEVLGKLEELREDRLNEHTGYWRLLASEGQKDKAASLAANYPHPPSSPVEVVELAQVYAQLDMRDQALQILQRYTKEFGHAALFWVAYAERLVEAKRWEELRNLAPQIRGEEAVREQLGAFSYFLEGRAELALGRESNALDAFSKAAEREFAFPILGQRVAAQLVQLGQTEFARQILERLEKPLEADARYWVLVFRVADQLKDVDLLVKSATKAYQLSPDDAAVANNYAAALIITRQRPEDAIKVTLPFLTQNPTSLHAVVNHSAALLLNGRPKEAEALLSRVRTNGLDRTQMALFQLDLFETYCGLEQYERAWGISDKIEADRLYPTQKRWLDEKRKQLPLRQTSG